MDYELVVGESPGEGIKRILIECVAYVFDLMIDPQPTREEAVHEARKTFKRIRAALRLAREETGHDWYRRENTFYRDLSRLLAPVRDSTVLVLSLEGVLEAYADIVPPQTFTSTHQKLLQRHEDIVHELLDEEDVMQIVAGSLEEAMGRLQAMPVSSDDFGIYADGLARVYRRGRKAMERANANPDDPVLFHEWRKRVKYLWHHMEILQQAWPLMLQDTGNELHLLSDFLGDAHDLVVLKETLLSEAELSAGNLNLVTLLALIDRRRERLEEASWTLGQRLYSERPEDFVKRIESYWEAWQRDLPATREALEKSAQREEELEMLRQELLDGSALLSTRDAADLLGMKLSRIREAIKEGQIKGSKVGRFWVIHKDSLAGIEHKDSV